MSVFFAEFYLYNLTGYIHSKIKKIRQVRPLYATPIGGPLNINYILYFSISCYSGNRNTKSIKNSTV